MLSFALFPPRVILIFFVFWASVTFLFAQDELLVKRENTFEFIKEPIVTKNGDQYQIDFEVKAFCDVTVSIEDELGNILRHVGSGVLGKKTPSCFQSNSLKQKILWDGKNDQGEYLANLKNVVVRVSLGLSPLYEKNLYWDPRRRQGREAPLMQSKPEGVYVYDGGTGMDYVKLFSHRGEYIKCVYPFPGDKIKDVKGLNIHTFPDGKTLPIKSTFLQQTFLTSGNDFGYTARKKHFFEENPSAFGIAHYCMEANASSMFAVMGDKIALGMKYLFRFATDGTSGGLDVEGPPVALIAPENRSLKSKNVAIVPRSAAFSPDGKVLYLTAYHFCRYGKATEDIVTSGDWHTFHCVLKMDFAGDKKPELFVGNMELDKSGSDDQSFFLPCHVATDKEGRVYVSDYMNDRVQIFSSDAKLLKSISVISPTQVCIHEKTQEIFIFSGLINTEGNGMGIPRKIPYKTSLTVLEKFPNLAKKSEAPLPKEFSEYGRSYGGMGFPLSATVTTDGKDTFIWLVKEWARVNVMLLNLSRSGEIANDNIKIYQFDKNKFEEILSFEKELSLKNFNSFPAADSRERLYVNPKNKKLYVSECRHAFVGKAFKDIREIDPNTGNIAKIELPFDAEDMIFDHKGFAYLRTLTSVGRFDISSVPWQEVPWDYGNENKNVRTDSGNFGRVGMLKSGVEVPGGGIWHHGGMHVNQKGQLAISCITPYPNEIKDDKFNPIMYPGRSMGGRGGNVAVHVYDQFGKFLITDFIPGLANNTYGIGLDNSRNLYVMASATRIYNGERYYNKLTGTLFKAKPNKSKIISVDSDQIPIPLPMESIPKESPTFTDPSYGKAWVQGAEWFFGGVGFSGKNAGVGCSCWNARMAFDYFNRSFAPEIDRYSVAVVDEEGNLILRIGQYGNCDSQGALSKAPLGGDEVGMTHGAYLATLTDKFLFISDPANQRIISVKLNYVKSSISKLPQ